MKVNPCLISYTKTHSGWMTDRLTYKWDPQVRRAERRLLLSPPESGTHRAPPPPSQHIQLTSALKLSAERGRNVPERQSARLDCARPRVETQQYQHQYNKKMQCLPELKSWFTFSVWVWVGSFLLPLLIW